MNMLAKFLFVFMSVNTSSFGAGEHLTLDLRDEHCLGIAEGAGSTTVQSMRSFDRKCERQCRYWYRHCIENCVDPACDQTCRVEYHDCLESCDVSRSDLRVSAR
jgi:hypothetical protein